MVKIINTPFIADQNSIYCRPKLHLLTSQPLTQAALRPPIKL